MLTCSRDDAARQEAEIIKEREASAARLKALEEQVKARKITKEEEKKKKKAAQAEQREKEARLAAQRAEIEAAQARERELQRQLESIDDEDSSDDEGQDQATPQASTPNQSSQEFERKEISPPPPPIPSFVPPIPPAATTASLPVASPASDVETKNPFLKKLAQAGGDGVSPSAQSAMSNNLRRRIPPNPLNQFRLSLQVKYHVHVPKKMSGLLSVRIKTMILPTMKVPAQEMPVN